MQNIDLLMQAITERAFIDYDNTMKRRRKCKTKYCDRSCRGYTGKLDCHKTIREIGQYVQSPMFTSIYPNIDGLELLKKIEAEGLRTHKYTKTK